ncbi:MAG: DUF4469 domain-containing protein [Hyphomicrobiales bacterium]
MSENKIRYSNRKNLLVKDEQGNDMFYPRIHIGNRYEEKELISMCTEGKGIPPEIFIASVDSFMRTIGKLLSNGNSFSSRWLNGSVRMKGSSTSKEEEFNPKNNSSHAVIENLRLPIDIRRKLFDSMNVQYIQEKHNATPIIEEIYQIYPRMNNVIGRGNAGKIIGKNLFCDEAVPDSGVYLINKEGNSTALSITASSNGQIVSFRVPVDIEAGEYFIHFVNSRSSEDKKVELKNKIIIE